MADKPVIFSRAAAKEIARAVRKPKRNDARDVPRGRIPKASPPGATAENAVLVYIFGNRTMGGAYKGYIIRDAAFNATIDSSSASFVNDDISTDIADIDETDAQEVTVLNMDETGLTTHALTAATQIKYIVLARTTTLTDDAHDDCMVVIIGDSDDELCEEA